MSKPTQYNQSPGPNAYQLRPLVGYPKHCVSKWRNPAYSMGLKTVVHGKTCGPGPDYKLDKMTRFGKGFSPAAPLGQRFDVHGKSFGPGPAGYNPNIKNIGKVQHNGPTFGVRSDLISKTTGPGPNAYAIKTPDPTLKRPPAVKFGGRTEMLQKQTGPGPNAYNPKQQREVKAVKFGPAPVNRTITDSGPGPGAYQGEKYLNYREKGNSPKFAFGVRTTNPVFISPEDNAVCELICKTN